MNKIKKTIAISIILASLITPANAVMLVQDNTLAALIREQTVNDTMRTDSLATLNWTMGAVNSFFAQIGTTQQMYEDFLNAHGLGGTKLGRYASSVLSKCIKAQMAKLNKIFKIPSVTICGTNIAADLANYLGVILNQKLNSLLKSWFGNPPNKEKSPTNPVSPGTEALKTLSNIELLGSLTGKNKARIKDENGDVEEINTSKQNAQPNGNLTYKKSLKYEVENSLINTTNGNTIADYELAANMGDKENMGSLDSPEIRKFYSEMVKQYVKVQKDHREMFLRHSYALKRVNDFFNTTFVKNSNPRIPENYTIYVPLPIAKVIRNDKFSNSQGEGGCLFTSDYASQKLGGCYVLNFGISFVPERTIVENPNQTLYQYTQGVKNVANKMIRKLLPRDGSQAARVFINKFDIASKIEQIKHERGYHESGINFASLSQLLTSYADLASKVVNMKSPEGRDYAKISYLKAILYQLTILNQQIYLYNKINTSIEMDRYTETYTHILNIEKELQKIRMYETFYLRKILLK